MPARLSQTEFIALMAMTVSTIAFSIDSMLPALPQIANELSPDSPNKAQLILTSFVLGMGLGTFFTGPLSDAFGRKAIVISGSVVYILAAAVAWRAQSLEVMLAARVVQGIGAAGPRIVALAITRDLYSGREMARIMSFIMMVFTLIPAIAPSIGAGLIAVTGWRGLFVAFIVFSLVASLWLGLRQSETLPVEKRRPIRIKTITASVKELFAHPIVRLSIAIQSLCFAMLFTTLSVVQPIYDVTFGRADSFHIWFGIAAIIAGSGSILNAKLVMRLGMRYLVSATLFAQLVLSLIMVVFSFIPLPDTLWFTLFVIWQTSLFFQAGMTIGNLNAMAMEPMGHIAGMAASVIGAVSTVFAVILAVPVGLAFDGTILPLALGVFCECALAVYLMTRLRRAEQATAAL